jgi:hypothetical protein
LGSPKAISNGFAASDRFYVCPKFDFPLQRQVQLHISPLQGGERRLSIRGKIPPAIPTVIGISVRD